MLKGPVRQKGFPSGDAPSCGRRACKGEVICGQESRGEAGTAQGGWGGESLCSWEPRVKRNDTEPAQGLGLIDMCRQVPSKGRRDGGNQWGGSATEPGSLCLGVFERGCNWGCCQESLLHCSR